MAGRLAGKAALLTAAAAGIGRATAEAFAREGARVVATDIDIAGLKGLDAETRKLDVRSNEAVEALAREIGPIDVLFNCAGFVHHGTVLDCSDADWDFSFDLNVKSTFFLSQYAGKHMLARKSGAIVNMGSQAGAIALPGEAVYCLSKAAISHMTKCFAVEWGKNNVRVNCVAPTFIETDGTADMLARPAFKIDVIERIAALHRIGQPREVADAVVFLASDAASLITGHTLLIDGGWTAR